MVSVEDGLKESQRIAAGDSPTPAHSRGIFDHGPIQPGMTVDLTIFDAETVTDRPTYENGENGLQPSGIPFVVVNGTVMVDNSNVLDIRLGRPIRFPVEESGRIQPISQDGCLTENTISDQASPGVETTGLSRILEQRAWICTTG